MYVIQVRTGSEQHTVDLFDSFVASELIEECFVPKRELMKRVKGEWRLCRELLFPGYVFVETRRVRELSAALRKVPAFARLLGNDNRFIPLTSKEADLLNAFTEGRERTLAMSEGVREGDDVRIVKGPLVDHRALVRKIDERKRLAYVELGMFNRTTIIKVGLEIVRT